MSEKLSGGTKNHKQMNISYISMLADSSNSDQRRLYMAQLSLQQQIHNIYIKKTMMTNIQLLQYLFELHYFWVDLFYIWVDWHYFKIHLHYFWNDVTGYYLRMLLRDPKC